MIGMSKPWMIALLLAPSLAFSQEGKPGLAERVAAVRKAFAESNAKLKHYEWVETTVFNLKGEDKSTKVSRCYWGADGVLQKILVSETPEPKKKFGLRGAIAKHKKEEIEEYMEKAEALIHKYVPPSPDGIHAAKEAGNASIDILDPEKKVRLNFKSYLLPGDVLSIDFDLAANRVLAVHVKTYVERQEDAVTLDVTIGTFEDGTLFSQKTVLKAEAKEVVVTTTNSGYRKTGSG
jgi:hypothetical protein